VVGSDPVWRPSAGMEVFALRSRVAGKIGGIPRWQADGANVRGCPAVRPGDGV